MEQSVIVRNLDPDSAAWIEREAKRRGIKAEELTLQLIRRGIIFEQEQTGLPEYHDLDSLAGTWDETETEQFLQAISDFETLDEDLWQ